MQNVLRELAVQEVARVLAAGADHAQSASAGRRHRGKGCRSWRGLSSATMGRPGVGVSFLAPRPPLLGLLAAGGLRLPLPPGGGWTALAGAGGADGGTLDRGRHLAARDVAQGWVAAGVQTDARLLTSGSAGRARRAASAPAAMSSSPASRRASCSPRWSSATDGSEPAPDRRLDAAQWRAESSASRAPQAPDRLG